MKKLFCIALCIVFMFSFAACRTVPDTPSDISSLKYIGDRDLKVKYDSITTLKEVMEDVSVVNINMEMGSIDGLEKQTETDEENGTSIDYYYRGNERIYAVYNGYSENIWQYFTTSKSGVPIVASFWRDGDNSNVKIETDATYDKLGYLYAVDYNDIGTDYGNGAKTIDVSVTKDGETYTYRIDGNHYYVNYAIYWADSELHRFTADAEDGKVTYHYDEVVISSEVPEKNPDDEAMLTQALSTDLHSVDILLGKHQIYQNKAGELLISAETTLVFDDEETAESAIRSMQMMGVKASDFTVERDTDDRYYIVNIGTYLFELSPEYKEGKELLFEFATNEFDDYEYKSVTFDSLNRITGFGPGDISYY